MSIVRTNLFGPSIGSSPRFYETQGLKLTPRFRTHRTAPCGPSHNRTRPRPLRKPSKRLYERFERDKGRITRSCSHECGRRANWAPFAASIVDPPVHRDRGDQRNRTSANEDNDCPLFCHRCDLHRRKEQEESSEWSDVAHVPRRWCWSRRSVPHSLPSK